MFQRDRRGRDRMVVGFTTTYAISACQYWRYDIESRSGDTTLCDQVCQWLVAGRWFSQCRPISSTNKTDHHDITEILLKVALNTINLNHKTSILEIGTTKHSWWNTIRRYRCVVVFFKCSMIWDERWMFVLLIFVELFKVSFHKRKKIITYTNTWCNFP